MSGFVIALRNEDHHIYHISQANCSHTYEVKGTLRNKVTQDGREFGDHKNLRSR